MEEGEKGANNKLIELIVKHFFTGKKIDQEVGREFREAVNAMNPVNCLHTFISYMKRIFQGYTVLETLKGFPAGLRVYNRALEIYSNGLMDYFDKLFESRPGYVYSGIRKQDFIAFLCGINMDPFEERYKIEDNYHNMAESGEPILITGETGTGKELHAKLFHYLSLQRKKRFLALNCSGISENLLESQLFGYVKGAFTGAIQDTDGILQSVVDGTLFLDEIGDMSPNLQAKILRVLETGDYYRVGEYKKQLSFKGRIIAATNKNLEAEILKDQGRFRPDLYFRVSVFTVKLPSFRILPYEIRKEKLNSILKQQYLRYDILRKSLRESSLSEEYDIEQPIFNFPCTIEELSPDAEDLLLGYDYPGNYRELTNIVKSALLKSGGAIAVGHLPEAVRNHKPTIDDKSGHPTHDPFRVEDVKARDIITYAEGVKRTIVEKKIEHIYRSGKDLKNVLRSEGINDEKDYVNFNSQITRIVGKERLKTLRTSAKQ